jgi:hypothetical protein
MSWYSNHGSDRFAIFNRARDIPTCLGRAWAGDRPGGPKLKLLVVELAGRPNERRLYGGRVLSLPILGGLHYRYVRV